MSNKKKGSASEARYLHNNRLFQFAGTRFYASMGLFDVIFVDKDYVTRLVQIKSSSKKGKKPYISPQEIEDIKTYVDQFQLHGKKYIWVGYVMMQWRLPPLEVRLN
jgi:Holliday junction resolvase